jgi:uncharacterized protein (TIGR02147 family)
MNIFEERNYRTILKNSLKEQKQGGRSLTLKKVAARIGVQYTYLSRALNREDTHLNEDHLLEVCSLLGFFPEETEYLLCLRGLELSSSRGRRDFLEKKTIALKAARGVGAAFEKNPSLGNEVNFLLSPLCWLVYFALGISEYRENPRRIAVAIGIDPQILRSSLQTLSDLSLIEIGENVMQVKKINKNHFHYHPDHPLTRVHQQMLRLACDNQFLRLPENSKQRFMVTFNADTAALEKIKGHFQIFIKEVEKIVVASPSKETHQLNFELFRWF